MTAGFLIIGKGDVDRLLEPGLLEHIDRTEDAGQKALHVDRTAAIEAIVLTRQFKRVGFPGLAFHRHDIGVAIEHDAAIDLRSDCDKDVGLFAGFVVAEAGGQAVARQVAGDVTDDIVGRAAGDGRKADKLLKNFDRMLQAVSHDLPLPSLMTAVINAPNCRSYDASERMSRR